MPRTPFDPICPDTGDAFSPDHERDPDAARDYATVVDPEFDDELERLHRGVADLLGYGVPDLGRVS